MSMPFHKDSEASIWMTRTMDLARRSEGLASPNPQVGAVLVRAGRIVGEGFHAYAGLRHAEIIALEKAGKHARGATLYINIEPCCTTGRTGPCAKALIAAGVSRVVAAMDDPNPAVAGRGFRELQNAGIGVEISDVGGHAHKLNESFAKSIRTGQPFVTLKTAITLDGQAALPRVRGARGLQWITSEESRHEVQRARHESDAILTGIGTVLADDPLLTDRSGLPRRRKLLRVVLDSELRLPVRSRVARTAESDVLVFTAVPPDSARAKRLRKAGVEIVRVAARGGKLDLHEVMRELGRRDILSVILESGPTLNRAALEAGIVDKMRLFIAPQIAGASANLPAFAGWGMPRPHALQNVTFQTFGPDISLEGYLHDVYRNR
jgi:diaminohydroxyphosphoribosylaminopyrimidine deaminase / 5-amino-6-(5-phosphoribosylamino)uracil reductase